jgi:hypothetical protein
MEEKITQNRSKLLKLKQFAKNKAGENICRHFNIELCEWVETILPRWQGNIRPPKFTPEELKAEKIILNNFLVNMDRSNPNHIKSREILMELGIIYIRGSRHKSEINN